MAMQHINELYQKLETCDDNNRRLDLLFDIATNLLNFDERKVLEVADEIKALADTIDSAIGRSYYFATKGRVLFKKSLYAECEEAFRASLVEALKTDDLVHQAMCYDSMGILHTFRYQHEEALEACHKALNTYLKMPGRTSSRYLGVCYNNIGATYQRLYDLDEAYRYFMMGLEAESIMEDRRIKFNILNNLCLTLVRQGMYDEGMAYIVEAVAGFKKLQHKNGEVHAMVLQAHCHLGKGDYAIAMAQYLNALKILKEIVHKPIEIHALRGLAQIYMKWDAVNDAISYYKKALSISESIDDDFESCETLKQMGEAYMLIGESDKAENFYAQGLEIAKKIKLSYFQNQFVGLLAKHGF